MWADHVVRTKQHRILKKVLGSSFGGGRPVGRPRNRWKDIIQRDATNLLLIRNWKAAARDKEECRKKVGVAMAIEGEGEGEEEVVSCFRHLPSSMLFRGGRNYVLNCCRCTRNLTHTNKII
jgi:hypothetical protein